MDPAGINSGDLGAGAVPVGSGDVSYATVYLVRNALAGIERATCSTERLAVRTASCGSRRERFAARRVGEHVSSDVAELVEYSQPFCASVWAYRLLGKSSLSGRYRRFSRATRLGAIERVTEDFSKPLVGQACSLDVGERIAHALNGGEAKNTDGGRPPAYAAAIGP
ncbi:hypothetical protein EMIHUDRAFT_231484 [Emiliania huxleyi CCMP1516]|uniref:Uncharacterized protein n=2 Tax=Emiliania huxleyi TaxID=2903 RepID=A0A0D3K7G1_EMIH1|nr:hypothetical protein EMIHUDRAFT_231484 [Emiliania huxleyi CCMP1516]EOD31696.1 hypothetical protein EMIHUDRAFT_231484 [Emiliania huxleyi CCMP1516]|eukprot:XP_005784125.1 hypothetical protein EMIHUDRAFT_231484 [Emiliania huxleyi CCMP1516]